MTSPDGRSRAVMEYPITTMNVEPDKKIWQVDTGPALFADFERPADGRIEKMIPGFIVYNSRNYAEWALRAKVTLPPGGTPHHFADLRRGTIINSIYSGVRP